VWPVCLADVDECRKTHDGPCDVNADCINTAGSYQCVCRDRYSGNGLACSRMLHQLFSLLPTEISIANQELIYRSK